MPQLRWIVLGVALLTTAAIGNRPKIAAQDGPLPPKAKPPAGKVPADEEPPLLLTAPKTPEEQFRAATLMYRLGRPNLAMKYLQQLMSAKPDEATLLKLRDKFGPADFLRLANAKELQPLSRELLRQVNAAFRKRGADPRFINRLIDDLSGDPADRDVALTTLKNTGPIVVPRIMERLAAETDSKRAALLQEALIDFGEPAVPPLVAALDSPATKVKTAAITALGFIGLRDTAPYLWNFAYNSKVAPGIRSAARQALARIYKTDVRSVANSKPASVSGELMRLALQYFRGEARGLLPAKPTSGKAKTTAVWVWNDGTMRRTSVSPREADLFVGTRFAREALELAPRNREAQALFAAMSLSASADPTWERPLPQGKGTPFNAALAAGSEVVNDALALSLKHGDSNAATSCLLVLRQVATKNDLRPGGSHPGGLPPIVAAMNAPDARVQFAAAATVLTIDPDAGFRGVSRVVPILARALTDDGAAKALVVNASVQKGATLAGLLGELGYEPQIARTGREGFRLATQRNDIGLILLQLNTIRWPLSQTLANFRADPRTKSIPIAVYGPDGMKGRVQSHLDRYPLLAYIVESTTGEHLAMQLRPFLQSVKSAPLSGKQRAQQRDAAAYWLSYIAAGKRSQIYDLAPAEAALAAAVTDSAIATNAVQALAAIPTRGAQRALFTAVTADAGKRELRITAASLLATHIQRFGLLLTDEQVAGLKRLRQATGDAELSAALATIMGSLKPDAQRAGAELERVPLPMLPLNK